MKETKKQKQMMEDQMKRKERRMKEKRERRNKRGNEERIDGYKKTGDKMEGRIARKKRG